jgi:hypothetical protein
VHSFLRIRRCPFIQRLRARAAGFIALAITILTLGKIKVDPTGTMVQDRGRGGIDSAVSAAPEGEE